ncbi:MAG: (d)CMP kinase [Mycoplasmataceae bacterium]|jgi:cytidylate kinase|nr:(d)CMP kinase [Mycoplasmataceae bacterium]
MANKVRQIAIDGPGGAGKSTIAQAVAKKLGFLFINTGGMYRCYGIALQNADLTNIDEVKKILNENKVMLTPDKLYLNNKDVTAECYTAPIAMLASKIGTIGAVREKCVKDQQIIAAGQSCVMEGRDTTTVVLPNATLKVFLTASLETRAKRRWLQNNKRELLEDIKNDLVTRDYQDSHRAIAPLMKAPDAITIDTDGKSFDENVQQVIRAFELKRVLDD